MKLMPKVEVRHVLPCPSCQKGSWSYGHLPNGIRFGPWFCDECGVGIFGTSTNDGGADVEVITKERLEKRIALLRLRKTEGPVFIIIKADRVRENGETEADLQGHDAYHYNEGTCPINFLGVDCIMDGDDDDPHGIFQFVASIPYAKGASEELLKRAVKVALPAPTASSEA